MTNVAADEVAKFDALSHQWWDPDGAFKTLHDINATRLSLITERQSLSGCDVVDVGCGGGILSEALARAGARITGIDLSPQAIAVARDHAANNGLTIDYQHTDVSALAGSGANFDVVVCMELLEHVPQPDQLVADCAALVRAGGWLFLSTLNRTATAWLKAVVGAEHVLRLLPRGTHSYRKFIRPAELATWLRAAGMNEFETTGLDYQPWSRKAQLSTDHSVNYVMICRRPAND